MKRAFLTAVIAVVVASSANAWAIPAFARKYHTSCETCHTVFPKLTPFGEAFRRNGFRFPGVDSDFVKAEPVPLGQDAFKKMFPDAVWPGSLAPSVPIAVGFNGTTVIHPDTQSSGGQADGGNAFSMDSAIEEAHVWGGGSLDDGITFFSELTFSADGVEVESANLHFNDLVGPQHLVNVTFGKAPLTLNSFGQHSTYVDDVQLPLVPVPGFYGAQSDSYNLVDNYNQVEVTGTAEGRFDYSLGLDAGVNADPRNTQDLHAHVGYKLGGMRLDGEDAADDPGSADPDAEHSLTLDAFYVRGKSNILDAAGNSQDDLSMAFGGSARGQFKKLELDAGVVAQTDSHAAAGNSVDALCEWDELSYRLYPWLVPAVRSQYVHLKSGGAAVSDLQIVPGVAALVRPNVKFVLAVPLERASGAPDGGWSAADGLYAAPRSATATLGTELEAVDVTLWAAF